eukprot:7545-Heterococcus_DN1.PRE.3
MQQKLLESLLCIMPHALPVHWQLLDCAALSLSSSSRANAMLPWAFRPCICVERKELTDLVFCNLLRALLTVAGGGVSSEEQGPCLRYLCVLDADEHLPDAMAVRACTRLPSKTQAPAPTRKSVDKPAKDSVDKLKDTWPTFQDQKLLMVFCIAYAVARVPRLVIMKFALTVSAISTAVFVAAAMLFGLLCVLDD